MIILGIDQGLANIGFSLVKFENNTQEIIKYGTITTKSNPNIGKRLIIIRQELQRLIHEYKPDLICTETLYCKPSGSSRFNRAATIVKTNMATGVICLVSAENNIELKQYAPVHVKKVITGNGRAKKNEVEAGVLKILGKDVKFKVDHEADATAIALVYVMEEEKDVKKENI